MDIPKDEDGMTIQDYHTETLEKHNDAIASLIKICRSLNEEAKIQTKYMDVNNKRLNIDEDRISNLENIAKAFVVANLVIFVILIILAIQQ